MAKRLTEKQKDEILNSFLEGKTIEFLSQEFNFNKMTIVRNLKKSLGESKYRKIMERKKDLNLKDKNIKKGKNLSENFEKPNSKEVFFEATSNDNFATEFSPVSSFLEIAPLDLEIDDLKQKDFSSVPISEINFPKTVYMIVDRKIELETKFLKDYPEWQFLSEDELNRKTIEIHDDLKNAKSRCNKEQKVIKVPNTNVLKLAAPFLISRGITRIVSTSNLIAL